MSDVTPPNQGIPQLNAPPPIGIAQYLGAPPNQAQSQSGSVWSLGSTAQGSPPPSEEINQNLVEMAANQADQEVQQQMSVDSNKSSQSVIEVEDGEEVSSHFNIYNGYYVYKK